MKKIHLLFVTTVTVAVALAWGCAHPSPGTATAPGATPAIPSFSVKYMDRSVDPGTDFYRYACGNWLKQNPVPADKSRWSAFEELQQRNWSLIHNILDTSAADHAAPPKSPIGEVGEFYRSAMDTNRIEAAGFKPVQADFARIAAVKTKDEYMRLLAELGLADVSAMFGAGVSPDERNSGFYAFHLTQGGLGLPDRDYYLTDAFADKRAAYQLHIATMFEMTGEAHVQAAADAAKILDIETALAKASKPRADLRDPIANYHKFSVTEAAGKYPHFPLRVFLDANGVPDLQDIIIHQPEFFTALDKLVEDRPLDDWKTYLRWHVLTFAARYLHSAAEDASFAFYGTTLSGQPQPEPRWQRAARTIDSHIGEALGQLYVEKNFPPVARARMTDLVENLKAVFRDRLQKVAWMTDTTRAKAIAKFDRFTQKIGYPAKFRDYSSVEIRPDDYFGNICRANIFESKRELARVGKPVDKTEWGMTPETVNAYFSPDFNEIVFPAGILQPPFFDFTMDDAVNYGAIGVVIGHEITHGYDDEGRKYDAEGNLNEWWTPEDSQAFETRAQKVVDQYSSYEAIPGLHVNGKLTLGENLADLGGMTIAYDALERTLAKNPSARKNIDGLTPEQRFFISFAQIWRTNWRDAELRRRVTVDPHSPGQFRAIGPEANLQQFYDAFSIKDGSPMWRSPDLRAIIW